MKELLTKRRITVFFVTLTTVALLSFIVWPVEKADYSKCGVRNGCFGTFSSKVFGGVDYLSKINQYKDSLPDPTILKQRYSEKDKAVYSFGPLPVLAVSLLVGAGAGAIAVIVDNKLQRSKN